MVRKDGIAENLRRLKKEATWNVPRTVVGVAGILLLSALTASAISAEARNVNPTPVAAPVPLDLPLPDLPARQPLSGLQSAPAQDGWIVGLAPEAKTEALGLSSMGDFREYPRVARGPRFGVLHPKNGQLGLAERRGIAGRTGVLYVEPNGVIQLDEPQPTVVKVPDRLQATKTVSNDPMLVSEWWARALNLPYVWPTATSSTIGLVDTGCDVTHPDLQGLVAPEDQIDVTSGVAVAGSVPDPAGHGTSILGIMAMIPNNGIGGVGIDWAPRRIVCVKVANGMTTTDALMAYGINVAAQKGVQFLNVSWIQKEENYTLQQAVQDYLAGGNNYLFAACGNEAGPSCDIPAAWDQSLRLEGLVSVGALGTNMKLAYFSNSGADFDEPGYNICSTWPGGTYGCTLGTSDSTPMAMTMAAIAHDRNGVSMARADFLNFLKNRANKLGHGFSDPVYGYGMLDAGVMEVLHPSTTFFPVVSVNR